MQTLTHVKLSFNTGTAYSLLIPNVDALLALCGTYHLADWDHAYKRYINITPANARAMWHDITAIDTDDHRIDHRNLNHTWRAHYVLDAHDATVGICGPQWHYKRQSHTIGWNLEMGLHYTPNPLPPAAITFLQAVNL